MSQPSQRVSAEALVAHAEFVRALARRLAGESAAEDVAQETLLRSLERPPARTGSLRSWLATVATRLVRQGQRSEVRRRRRESAVARGEKGESTLDTVARRELLRDVVEAIGALPPAQQDVLLLRYYEGLPPREIARRTGVPRDTVKVRLKRALASLRTRLDRAHGGDRRAWLLPLCTLSGSKRARSETVLEACRWLLPRKIEGLIAASALAVVSAGLVGRDPSPVSAASGGLAERALAVTAPAAKAEAEDRQASTVRSIREPSVAIDVDTPSPPRPSTTPRLFGTVTDQEGRAVDAWVVISDPFDPATKVRQRGARFSFEGLSEGRWEVSCWAPGYRPLDRELVLGRSPSRIDFTLHRWERVGVRLLTPNGRPLREALEERYPPRVVSSLSVVASREPPGELPIVPQLDSVNPAVGEYLERGRASFRNRSQDLDLPSDIDGMLELRSPAPLYVSIALRSLVLATEPVPVGAPEVTIVADPSAIEADLCGISLRVREARTGAPLTGARVRLETSQTLCPPLEVDAQGGFSRGHLAPGLWMLSIEAPGYEVSRRQLVLRRGSFVDLGLIALTEPATLQGRVRDESGAPLRGRIVVRELERDAAWPFSHRYGAETDEQGRFRVEGLGGRRYSVFFEGDGEHCVNPELVELRAGEASSVELVIERGTRVELQPTFEETSCFLVTIRDAGGCPVWSHFLRRGISSPRSLRLRPGPYSVSLTDLRNHRRTIDFFVGPAPLELPVSL